MATNKIQDGKIMNFTNTTDADITSSSPIFINSKLGVALTDIPKLATGSVAMEGVFKLAKTSGEIIAQGEKVYIGGSSKITKEINDDYVGYAFEKSLSTDQFVHVKINS